MIQAIGAFCFGSVFGWLLRLVLAHAKEISVNSIATVLAALGGASVTLLFPSKEILFSWYCIGLFVGFFGHVLLSDIDPNTGAIRYKGK